MARNDELSPMARRRLSDVKPGDIDNAPEVRSRIAALADANARHEPLVQRSHELQGAADLGRHRETLAAMEIEMQDTDRGLTTLRNRAEHERRESAPELGSLCADALLGVPGAAQRLAEAESRRDAARLWMGRFDQAERYLTDRQAELPQKVAELAETIVRLEALSIDDEALKAARLALRISASNVAEAEERLRDAREAERVRLAKELAAA